MAQKQASNKKIAAELETALKKLCREPAFFRLIPEVASNFVYLKEGGTKEKDALAVEGRIRRGLHNKPIWLRLAFGASGHVARGLIAFHALDGVTQSAINLSYSQQWIHACASAGLTPIEVDRSLEPSKTRQEDGDSMKWVAMQAWEKNNKQPVDCFYHKGEWGKEPMSWVLGKNPAEVLAKARKAFGYYEKMFKQ